MSFQTETEGASEHRREIAAKSEEFAAFATRFHEEVDEKRDPTAVQRDFADTRKRFREAQTGFSGYSDEFTAASRAKIETVGLTEKIESFREAVSAHTAEVEAYAEAFNTDVAAKRGTARLSEKVATLRERAEAVQSDWESYRQQFLADVAAYRERQAVMNERFNAYRREKYADSVPTPVEEPEAVVEQPPSTDERPDAGESPDTETDEHVTETPESDADPADTDAEESEPEPETDDQSGSEGDDEPVAEAESVDEVSQQRDDAATAEEFKDQLSEMSYGTLKRAANAFDYGGNLNSATKEELIEFFTEKEIDEIKTVLEEE